MYFKIIEEEKHNKDKTFTMLIIELESEIIEN
jgi:hypothetical protein